MSISTRVVAVQHARASRILIVAVIAVSLRCHAQTALDDGFHSLYNFNFVQAQQHFASWQELHPEDPLGSVAEAAGYLFSEFDRLGVLEIQLLVKDSPFESGKELLPDAVIRAKFDGALKKAESKANLRLAKDPRDRDALFATTLIFGLKADYKALIEKSNIASLRSSTAVALESAR
jgi:hypothetical protein